MERTKTYSVFLWFFNWWESIRQFEEQQRTRSFLRQNWLKCVHQFEKSSFLMDAFSFGFFFMSILTGLYNKIGIRILEAIVLFMILSNLFLFGSLLFSISTLPWFFPNFFLFTIFYIPNMVSHLPPFYFPSLCVITIQNRVNQTAVNANNRLYKHLPVRQ